jgi:Family of unknown function (DUF6308)/Protein of unknown function (DUF3293)
MAAKSKVPKHAIRDYLPTDVSVEVGSERVPAMEYAEMNRLTLHVITAWNPPNVPRTENENNKANDLLRSEIESRGFEAINARGSDPSSPYFKESWAVVGLNEEEAILLGRKFEQAAIFRVTRNRQTVLGCDEKRWSIWRGNRKPLGIQGAIDFINDSQNAKYLQSHFDRYFALNDSTEIFQGRNFEWFAKETGNAVFLPMDFLAISALSVDVPAETQRLLLEDIGGKFSELLVACGKYESENHMSKNMDWLWERETPFMELHSAVEVLPGVGRVVCSKLLAAKFPHLIPIRDSRVEKLFRIKPTGLWWKPLHEIHEAVEPTLLKLNGIDSAASSLRALDVLLWMESSERGF